MAKIFVIEDDRTIAELLQAALQHDGDEVCLSLQGKLDALDETFDLVLLDLMMPDADGLELAQQIRGTYDLPIIMLTARGELRDKVAGFEAGADDYVTKPLASRNCRPACARSSSAPGAEEASSEPAGCAWTPSSAGLGGGIDRSTSAGVSSTCWPHSRGVPGGCSAGRSCSIASGALSSRERATWST